MGMGRDYWFGKVWWWSEVCFFLPFSPSFIFFLLRIEEGRRAGGLRWKETGVVDHNISLARLPPSPPHHSPITHYNHPSIVLAPPPPPLPAVLKRWINDGEKPAANQCQRIPLWPLLHAERRGQLHVSCSSREFCFLREEGVSMYGAQYASILCI